jgi:hypothetical protein
MRDLHDEGTDCSWSELNQNSDFLQEIAARAIPANRTHPDSNSLYSRAASAA